MGGTRRIIYCVRSTGASPPGHALFPAYVLTTLAVGLLGRGVRALVAVRDGTGLFERQGRKCCAGQSGGLCTGRWRVKPYAGGIELMEVGNTWCYRIGLLAFVRTYCTRVATGIVPATRIERASRAKRDCTRRLQAEWGCQWCVLRWLRREDLPSQCQGSFLEVPCLVRAAGGVASSTRI